jgi:hypothetical protein
VREGGIVVEGASGFLWKPGRVVTGCLVGPEWRYEFTAKYFEPERAVAGREKGLEAERQVYRQVL